MKQWLGQPYHDWDSYDVWKRDPFSSPVNCSPAPSSRRFSWVSAISVAGYTFWILYVCFMIGILLYSFFRQPQAHVIEFENNVIVEPGWEWPRQVARLKHAIEIAAKSPEVPL